MKKIKDLPFTQLIGHKVRTKKGVIGYVVNSADSVVFLSPTKDKFVPVLESKADENRLYPQVLTDIKDIKDWDIVEDEHIKTNCADLTSLKYILNE